jgi:hypothetical protein
VPALLLGELGPVPDEETGIAGELILFLRDDRDGQLLAGQVRTRELYALGGIGLVELADDAPRIGRVRRTEGLEGSVTRFRNVGAYFVIIGCHLVVLISVAGCLIRSL